MPIWPNNIMLSKPATSKSGLWPGLIWACRAACGYAGIQPEQVINSTANERSDIYNLGDHVSPDDVAIAAERTAG